MLGSSQNSYVSPGGTGHDIVNREEQKERNGVYIPHRALYTRFLQGLQKLNNLALNEDLMTLCTSYL